MAKILELPNLFKLGKYKICSFFVCVKSMGELEPEVLLKEHTLSLLFWLVSLSWVGCITDLMNHKSFLYFIDIKWII